MSFPCPRRLLAGLRALQRLRRGFTVLELLLAVVIVGVLATLVLAKFADTKQSAYIDAEMNDLRTFMTQAELYQDQHGSYPASPTMAGVNFRFSPDVSVFAYQVAPERWAMITRHAKTNVLCSLRYGVSQGPTDQTGRIRCSTTERLDFSVSDAAPAVGTPVTFDATAAIATVAFRPTGATDGGVPRAFALGTADIALVAWSFGDGTGTQGPADSARVTHVYQGTVERPRVQLAVVTVDGFLYEGSQTLEVQDATGGGQTGGSSSGGSGGSGSTGGSTGGTGSTGGSTGGSGGAAGGGGSNQLPTARIALHPLPVVAGSPITLDGQGSTDPDGTIASYAWVLGSGMQVAGAQVTLTLDTPGQYPVRLTVTDNQGGTADTTDVISVLAPNVPPVARLTLTPNPVVANADLTLDARSSTDADGQIVRVAWDLGDFRTAQGLTATARYAAPGRYGVRVTVTDDRGATATAEDSVTVTPANVLPVARIGRAPAGVVTVGDTVAFDGTPSSDADGTVVRYTWTMTVGGGTYVLTGPVATAVVPVEGNITARLEVTDDRGGVGAAVETVYGNQRPTARLTRTPSSTIIQLGQAVTFDASTSTDTDGSIASYTWTFADTTFVGGPVVTHTFRTGGAQGPVVVVADDQGATGTASSFVDVNSPPVVLLRSNLGQHFRQGELLVLHAEDTYDPDRARGDNVRTFDIDWGDWSQHATDFVGDHTFSAGRYEILVTVTDYRGGTGVGRYFVTVDATPRAIFGVTPATAYVGDTLTLTDSSTDADGTIASRRWTANGVPLASSAGVVQVPLTVAGPLALGLTVTDNDGYTATASQTVTVGDVVSAAFSVTPGSPAVNSPATFMPTTASGVSHLWTFAAGQTSTAASPSYTFTSAGAVTVTHQVTDARGRTLTASQTVTVVSDPTLPPGGVAGASLWLDAADVSTVTFTGAIDSTITTWRDKSSRQVVLQAQLPDAGASRPQRLANILNGKGVVRFGGLPGRAILQATTATGDMFTGGYTIFVVARTFGTSFDNSTNNYQYLIGQPGYHSGVSFVATSGTTPNAIELTQQCNGAVDASGNWSPTPSSLASPRLTGVTQGSWYAIGGRSGTTAAPNACATQVGTGATLPSQSAAGTGILTGYSNPLRLGAAYLHTGGYHWPLKGEIAEVIVYPRRLTDAEYTTVASALKTKWGL